MHPDKILEILDTEVGERHDAVIADAVDPDDAVLDLHFGGNIPQPIFVFAKFGGDTTDRGDVMDLVDVHGQAARSESAGTGGSQFQGSSSSMR